LIVNQLKSTFDVAVESRAPPALSISKIYLNLPNIRIMKITTNPLVPACYSSIIESDLLFCIIQS
jgi:hypothetical protein